MTINYSDLTQVNSVDTLVKNIFCLRNSIGLSENQTMKTVRFREVFREVKRDHKR